MGADIPIQTFPHPETTNNLTRNPEVLKRNPKQHSTNKECVSIA